MLLSIFFFFLKKFVQMYAKFSLGTDVNKSIWIFIPSVFLIKIVMNASFHRGTSIRSLNPITVTDTLQSSWGKYLNWSFNSRECFEWIAYFSFLFSFGQYFTVTATLSLQIQFRYAKNWKYIRAILNQNMNALSNFSVVFFKCQIE